MLICITVSNGVLPLLFPSGLIPSLNHPGLKADKCLLKGNKIQRALL